MTELEKKIQEAAQKYYTSGNSEYTDEEFDALVYRLKVEQPDSILLRVGWGYDVSEDNTPGAKREHKYTLIGSLDKCHNMKELGKRFTGITLDASAKLDGLSIVLYYEAGFLKYALTRGDGATGIDVTDKVLKINSNFSKTSTTFTGAVRGEILMSFKKFEEFKKLHPESKNPRNSAAGLINGKDTFEDLKYLDIVLYTLVHCEDVHAGIDTVTHTREFIDHLFGYLVPVVPYVKIEIPEIFSDDQLKELMEETKDILHSDYPTDGIVLTDECVKIHDDTFQYTAEAFKFPAESKITEVVDVEWNMSKTKNAVPRVLLKPVQVSGATVQACAGYHAQYIQENCIGPGTIVEIRRSGEVIPQIINIIKSTESHLPATCPDCGEPLFWEGVHLVCKNKNCSNSVEQDLMVWLQNLVPLDNLGDTLKMKFLNRLVDNGSMKNLYIESVMNCKIRLDENSPSTQFNNFAKMWNNLHDFNFKFDLVHALMACNIPRIGDITAVKFSNYPDVILNLLDSDSEDVLIFLKLGKLIGQSNMLSVEKNIHKLKRLNLIRDRIIWKKESRVEFKGKVAITGKLSVKRSDFEEELRRNGYEPTDTVNKEVKFLITENPSGQSTKNLRAAQLGITKITEYDFRFKYLK